jgi:transcriptional regulator with XRE-family HTH domain
MPKNSKTQGMIIAEEATRDRAFADEWERTALARVVAAQLIEYRADHGLSQKKLGERIDMKQPQVARLESGEHNPDIETLIRISRGLGIEFVVDIAPIATAKRKLVKPAVAREQAEVNGVVFAAAARRRVTRRRSAGA